MLARDIFWRGLCRVSVGLMVVTLLGAAGVQVWWDKREHSHTENLRELRVQHQRAAATLAWLRYDTDLLLTVMAPVDTLSVRLVDTFAERAETGGVRDWRLERIATSGDADASLAGSLRLIVDIAAPHGEALLAEIAALIEAGGDRPVWVSACRVERNTASTGPVLDTVLARCTLDWPWWSPT